MESRNKVFQSGVQRQSIFVNKKKEADLKKSKSQNSQARSSHNNSNRSTTKQNNLSSIINETNSVANSYREKSKELNKSMKQYENGVQTGADSINQLINTSRNNLIKKTDINNKSKNGQINDQKATYDIKNFKQKFLTPHAFSPHIINEIINNQRQKQNLQSQNQQRIIVQFKSVQTDKKEDEFTVKKQQNSSRQNKKNEIQIGSVQLVKQTARLEISPDIINIQAQKKNQKLVCFSNNSNSNSKQKCIKLDKNFTFNEKDTITIQIPSIIENSTEKQQNAIVQNNKNLFILIENQQTNDKNGDIMKSNNNDYIYNLKSLDLLNLQNQIKLQDSNKKVNNSQNIDLRDKKMDGYQLQNLSKIMQISERTNKFSSRKQENKDTQNNDLDFELNGMKDTKSNKKKKRNKKVADSEKYIKLVIGQHGQNEEILSLFGAGNSQRTPKSQVTTIRNNDGSMEQDLLKQPQQQINVPLILQKSQDQYVQSNKQNNHQLQFSNHFEIKNDKIFIDQNIQKESQKSIIIQKQQNLNDYQSQKDRKLSNLIQKQKSRTIKNKSAYFTSKYIVQAAIQNQMTKINNNIKNENNDYEAKEQKKQINLNNIQDQIELNSRNLKNQKYRSLQNRKNSQFQLSEYQSSNQKEKATRNERTNKIKNSLSSNEENMLIIEGQICTISIKNDSQRERIEEERNKRIKNEYEIDIKQVFDRSLISQQKNTHRLYENQPSTAQSKQNLNIESKQQVQTQIKDAIERFSINYQNIDQLFDLKEQPSVHDITSQKFLNNINQIPQSPGISIKHQLTYYNQPLINNQKDCYVSLNENKFPTNDTGQQSEQKKNENNFKYFNQKQILNTNKKQIQQYVKDFDDQSISSPHFNNISEQQQRSLKMSKLYKQKQRKTVELNNDAIQNKKQSIQSLIISTKRQNTPSPQLLPQKSGQIFFKDKEEIGGGIKSGILGSAWNEENKLSAISSEFGNQQISELVRAVDESIATPSNTVKSTFNINPENIHKLKKLDDVYKMKKDIHSLYHNLITNPQRIQSANQYSIPINRNSNKLNLNNLMLVDNLLNNNNNSSTFSRTVNNLTVQKKNLKTPNFNFAENENLNMDTENVCHTENIEKLSSRYQKMKENEKVKSSQGIGKNEKINGTSEFSQGFISDKSLLVKMKYMKELSKNLELLQLKEMEIMHKMNLQESTSNLNNYSAYSGQIHKFTKPILNQNNIRSSLQEQSKTNQPQLESQSVFQSNLQQDIQQKLLELQIQLFNQCKEELKTSEYKFGNPLFLLDGKGYKEQNNKNNFKYKNNFLGKMRRNVNKKQKPIIKQTEVQISKKQINIEDKLENILKKYKIQNEKKMDQSVGIHEDDLNISDYHQKYRLQPIISKIHNDDTFATREDEHEIDQFNQHFNIFSKFQNTTDHLIETNKDISSFNNQFQAIECKKYDSSQLLKVQNHKT